MLSSIKEFIIEKIFSGRKRTRSPSYPNNQNTNARDILTEPKFPRYEIPNYKIFDKDKTIYLIDDTQSSSLIDREISRDEILKKEIQISTNESAFYEKLCSFCKMKNDSINYPPIGKSEFVKLIR